MKYLSLFFIFVSLHVVCQDIKHVTVVTELAPPFQTITKSGVSGTSTKIVKDILSWADLEVRIHVMPWPRAFQKAKDGKNVLIYSIVRNNSREKQFHWIAPVIYHELALIGLANRKDISIGSIRDIKHYMISTLRDGALVEYFNNHGLNTGTNLFEVANAEDTWRLMLVGKVDLVIDYIGAVKRMPSKFGYKESDIKVHYQTTKLLEPAYLAASKDFDPALLEKIDTAFRVYATTEAYPHRELYTHYASTK